MAEKIKDADDRMLESLFSTPPLADAGFSARTTRRIKRRLWIRRLTVPVAGVIGGVIAYQPLTGLVTLAANFLEFVPQDLVDATAGSIPQTQIIVLGALLLGACLLGMRLLDE